jgi:RNA polymerase sigma-70 factor (ECF subfamily)
MHALSQRHSESSKARDLNGTALPMPTVGHDRDRELVDALRRRDRDAAERLVLTYQARAYRLAVGITNSPEDAEEVVEDACLKVVNKIDSFRGASAFGSWVYRIVANTALQKIRRRRGGRIHISLDHVLPAFDRDGRHATIVIDWSAAVDDPSRQVDVRLGLTSALEELPVHYRAALVMRDVEGCSCAEIAAALHVTVGIVKARVHRARLLIRKRLAEFLESSPVGRPVELAER